MRRTGRDTHINDSLTRGYKMTKKTVALTALALCFGMGIAAPTIAQPTTGAARETGVSEHHRMMADLMKDMSAEMNKMSEEMSRGNLTSEQRKQMNRRMENMSKMMRRMTGLEHRPAMRAPEMKKELDQMRKQMDSMKGDSSMGSPTK